MSKERKSYKSTIEYILIESAKEIAKNKGLKDLTIITSFETLIKDLGMVNSQFTWPSNTDGVWLYREGIRRYEYRAIHNLATIRFQQYFKTVFNSLSKKGANCSECYFYMDNGVVTILNDEEEEWYKAAEDKTINELNPSGNSNKWSIMNSRSRDDYCTRLNGMTWDKFGKQVIIKKCYKLDFPKEFLESINSKKYNESRLAMEVIKLNEDILEGLTEAKLPNSKNANYEVSKEQANKVLESIIPLQEEDIEDIINHLITGDNYRYAGPYFSKN